MEHTPGPWESEETQKGWKISNRSFFIAEVYNVGNPQANARLIAKAPEMYEALTNLVQWLEDSGLSATKAGGVAPFDYEGTEYSVVTEAKAALS